MFREKYQKAMVTGGAGFIGSHTVEECLSQGSGDRKVFNGTTYLELYMMIGQLDI